MFHCLRNCSSALFTSRQLIVWAKYFHAFATFEVPLRCLVLFDVAYCAPQVTFLLHWLDIARKQYECLKFILFKRLYKKSLWTLFGSNCVVFAYVICVGGYLFVMSWILRRVFACWNVFVFVRVYICVFGHIWGWELCDLGSSSWQLAELATAVAAQRGGKLHM